jgi:hypothetical protein
MIERCPNCHARWDGNRTCRRCGMELSALIAVEQAAERLITGAVACIAATEPHAAAPTLGRVLRRPEVTRALIEGATRDLTAAVSLHGTPFTRLLLGFAKQLAVGEGRSQPRPPASRESVFPGEIHLAEEHRRG